MVDAALDNIASKLLHAPIFGKEESDADDDDAHGMLTSPLRLLDPPLGEEGLP